MRAAEPARNAMREGARARKAKAIWRCPMFTYAGGAERHMKKQKKGAHERARYINMA